MSEIDLPPWPDVAAECGALALASTPSELHGALCGWLAGGGSDEPGWLGRIMPGQDAADDSLPAPPDNGALEQLREASATQLQDRGFAFALLLPDADAPLAQRSGALFDWCRGFLGGFGLAAGQDAQVPRAQGRAGTAAGAATGLSDEGREALEDLARLAAAAPQDASDEEDGDQEEEQALAELEEFVRVAALLLHGDCVLGARHRQRMH